MNTHSYLAKSEDSAADGSSLGPGTRTDGWGASGGVWLAFETSIRGGSVVMGTETQNLVAERLPSDQRSAATLIPAIKRQLADPAVVTAMQNSPNRHPGFVAVADGPGSFTGLRIAVTAAKALAYAWNAKLVVVDTLASVAAAAMVADEAVDQVQVVVNAYRGQVFAGEFRRDSLFNLEDGSAARGEGVTVQLASEIAEYFSPNGAMRISDVPAWNAEFKIDDLNVATGVAALAMAFAGRGEWFDPSALVPKYLKLSAAEESLSSRD